MAWLTRSIGLGADSGRITGNPSAEKLTGRAFKQMKALPKSRGIKAVADLSDCLGVELAVFPECNCGGI